MIYPLSIAFTMCYILYSKWQFSDDRGLSQGKWHIYGMIGRWIGFFTPLVMQNYHSPIDDYALAGTVNILLWEIGINLFALNEKWNHVGTTSDLDKALGKKKWWICFGLLAGAIIYKILIHEGGGKI